MEACARLFLFLLPRLAEDANSEAMEQLRRLHDEYEAYISHAKQTGAKVRLSPWACVIQHVCGGSAMMISVPGGPVTVHPCEHLTSFNPCSL